MPHFPVSRELTSPSGEMGEVMNDVELMKIAAFKLRESANRLLTLAQEASSQTVRGKLFAISKQLIRQEKRFYAGEQPE